MPLILNHKPAREIGITNRSVSGVVPSMGRYESSLERDLMEILRFDPGVSEYRAQPVTIEYEGPTGKPAIYTPDGLIHFHPTFLKEPVLYEVKYRVDFRKDWKILIPKFRAAKRFCLQEGWRFEVFTENEIRTPYLENVKFLWPYRERVPSLEMKSHVLQILWDLDRTDPDMLLCALCQDRENRGRMIPVIWHLVSTGAIGCDLNQPLNMNTPIWPKEDLPS